SVPAGPPAPHRASGQSAHSCGALFRRFFGLLLAGALAGGRLGGRGRGARDKCLQRRQPLLDFGQAFGERPGIVRSQGYTVPWMSQRVTMPSTVGVVPPARLTSSVTSVFLATRMTSSSPWWCLESQCTTVPAVSAASSATSVASPSTLRSTLKPVRSEERRVGKECR